MGDGLDGGFESVHGGRCARGSIALWCGVGGQFANTKDEGPNFWRLGPADAGLGIRTGVLVSLSGWAYIEFHFSFDAEFGTSHHTLLLPLQTLRYPSNLAKTWNCEKNGMVYYKTVRRAKMSEDKVDLRRSSNGRGTKFKRTA